MVKILVDGYFNSFMMTKPQFCTKEELEEMYGFVRLLSRGNSDYFSHFFEKNFQFSISLYDPFVHVDYFIDTDIHAIHMPNYDLIDCEEWLYPEKFDVI